MNKAPVCDWTASEANPMSKGNIVPPKSPIIINPDTSFCCCGLDSNACENRMENTFEFPNPTNAMQV